MKIAIFAAIATTVLAGSSFAQEHQMMANGLMVPHTSDVGSVPVPIEGEVYFDYGDNTFYGYNGSEWIDFAGAAQVGQNTTTTKYLSSTGDGTNPGAPTWSTIPSATATTSGLYTAGQAPGTPTSGNASAGNVGEYVESLRTTGLALTSAQYSDLNSITLTPGDWDITIVTQYNGNPTTGTLYTNSFIGTAAGNNATGLIGGVNEAQSSSMPNAAANTTESVPNYRVSISSSTTYYQKARAGFGAGSVNVYGRMSARRVR